MLHWELLIRIMKINIILLASATGCPGFFHIGKLSKDVNDKPSLEINYFKIKMIVKCNTYYSIFLILATI